MQALAEQSRYRCTIALLEFDPLTEKPTRFFVPYSYQPGEGIIEINEFVPTSDDGLNELLDAGQTIAIADVSQDDRVPQFLQEEQMAVGRPALALIPLVTGRRRIGNLILSHTQPEPWIDSELRLFQLAATLIAISVENTRRRQREQEMVALEERQRLARDLHDSVTQLIFSMMLMAQSVAPAYKRSVEEGERRIARMMELSQQALTEMRALLAELRPASPVENGLIPAIQQHIERISVREHIAITFEQRNYTPQSRPTDEALYRIVQEALNNTIKHAHATRAAISLQQADGQIRLTICDDGRGLNNEKSRPHPAGQFGLQGIRERVARLGGTLSLESEPGQGTTLIILLEENYDTHSYRG
jgi:signal transduction histidine kinase